MKKTMIVFAASMLASVVSAATATKEYVDAKDAATLQAAKDYTDQHGGGGGGAVQSVNGKTGAVVLDAAAIPYGGVESYEPVTNVEKGLDYAIFTADYAMTEATGRPTYDELNAKADQSYIDGTVIPAIGDAYSLADSAKQKADAVEPIAMDASQKAYAALDQLQSKVDASMISATDPTFSNAVATVAKTVTPPPSPTLRLYDEVRQCYWVGKMVDGVMQWGVE